jgi:hypothetical protein
VEKDLFNKVLHKYPASTAEEAQELLSLKDKFPYSQLLHVLTARVSKEHGLSQQQTELQMAAVYAADRGLLKSMMSNQETSRGVIARVAEVPEDTSADRVPETNNSNDIADRVIRDVKELYETRHNFEVMFVDNPGVDLVKSSVEGSDYQTKSKRERMIEFSKALNAQPSSEANETMVPKKKREGRKEIIDEIIDTKSQIEPENEKQKEQIKIIENFIKTQPSISSAKDKPLVPAGDLATIKTGEFGDNIVSETLVELLLKQGKKDKAIEVLKKLIWKFPQKKAYFAAQIEELKK